MAGCIGIPKQAAKAQHDSNVTAGAAVIKANAMDDVRLFMINVLIIGMPAVNTFACICCAQIVAWTYSSSTANSCLTSWHKVQSIFNDGEQAATPT